MAAEAAMIAPGAVALIPTGLTMALPQGYEAQIRSRSGLAAKHAVVVLNSPGTIDSDYRGEIKIILINHGTTPFEIKRGDRIAQMIVAPVVQANFVLVDSLDETERGTGGFGSTGVRDGGFDQMTFSSSPSNSDTCSNCGGERGQGRHRLGCPKTA